MAFRDDRDALLARMTALEAELAAARDRPDARELAAELDRLAAEVAAAKAEAESDRQTLANVGASIDRVRAKLNPPAPSPLPRALDPDATPKAVRLPRRDRTTLYIIGAVLLLFAGTIMIVTLSHRKKATAEVVVDPMTFAGAAQARVNDRAARLSGVHLTHVDALGLVNFHRDPEATVTFAMVHTIEGGHGVLYEVALDREGMRGGDATGSGRASNWPPCPLRAAHASARAALELPVEAVLMMTYPADEGGPPAWRVRRSPSDPTVTVPCP